MLKITKNLFAPISAALASLGTLLHVVAIPDFFAPGSYFLQSTAPMNFSFFWITAPLLVLIAITPNFIPSFATKISFLPLLNFVAAVVGGLIWIAGLVRLEALFNITSARDNFLDGVAAASGVFYLVAIYFASQGYLKGKDLPAKFRKSKVGGFFRNLIQGKLNEFLSRKIADVVFLAYSWFLVAAGVFTEIYILILLVGDFTFTYLLALIVFPIVWSLALIFSRMAFEAFVAVIAIAENTKKDSK